MKNQDQTELTPPKLGIGSNSEPQDIEPIEPEVNDLMDMDGNQVIKRYAPDLYKELMALIDESAALKKDYPDRVITDAEGRQKANDLSNRTNAMKNALNKIRLVVQLPHKEKYEQIRDSFNGAIKNQKEISDEWLDGVTGFDNRKAAKEAEIETARLQKIEDDRVEAENKRLAEEQALRDENEALRRQIAAQNTPPEDTPPAKPAKPAETADSGDTPPPPVQRDMLADSSDTPPPPAPDVQESEPPPAPTPPPQVKAKVVAQVEPELAANQEIVWFVESINPQTIDLNKLRDGFFGKGEIEAAANRYAKLNKGNAVIEGVVFDHKKVTKRRK